MNAYIDRLNYYNDPRVRAGARGDWFVSFDPITMTAEIETYDDDDNEVRVTIGATYEVCDTCGGRGSHTNPSVDAGGADTSDWDDEDFERYQSGSYDVACYECKGNRVVPHPRPRDEAEQKVLADMERSERIAAADRATQLAELAMGA